MPAEANQTYTEYIPWWCIYITYC